MKYTFGVQGLINRSNLDNITCVGTCVVDNGNNDRFRNIQQRDDICITVHF